MPSYKISCTILERDSSPHMVAEAPWLQPEYDLGELKDDSEAVKKARYWAAERCAVNIAVLRYRGRLMGAECWFEVGRV